MTEPIKNSQNGEYALSKTEIATLVQTMQDFKGGKTTARDGTEIEDELDHRYQPGLPNQTA